MRIYLAGPFFNPGQVEVIAAIERELMENGLGFYSPRSDGVLKDMTIEERKASTKRTFDRNVDEIEKASMILAVIDDRDPGTIWEIGFASAIGTPIVTFSNHGYGVNVMIKECVAAHVKGIDRLKELLKVIKEGKVSDLTEFRDFSEDVT